MGQRLQPAAAVSVFLVQGDGLGACVRDRGPDQARSSSAKLRPQGVRQNVSLGFSFSVVFAIIVLGSS